MGNEFERTPAGFGFELDYDKYAFRTHKKFNNADEWWEAYAILARDEWENFSFKDDLLKNLDGDYQLAWIVAHFVGANYKSWLLRRDIDGLGGYSPKECLKTIWGLKRLRMLFLQMAG